MIQLCWMPTWACQNYSPPGYKHNHNCPYCPLGLSDGRLTFDGKPGSLNGSVDPAKMASFLMRNVSQLGYRLSISGGEPLASPVLSHVLRYATSAGFSWGITSNTTLHKPLAKLSADLQGFASCEAWTASYHPFACVDSEYETGIRFIRENGARWVYASLVASAETIEMIESKSAWLASLPIDRVNILVDMYAGGPGNYLNGPRGTAIVEKVVELAERHPGRILPVGSGKTVTGTWCNTTGRFLVVSPTGMVYQCVQKCYHELDPIGSIDDVTLSAHGSREWCGLNCPHTCDQVKHVV